MLASTQGRVLATTTNSGVAALTWSPGCSLTLTAVPPIGATIVVRSRSSAARSRSARLLAHQRVVVGRDLAGCRPAPPACASGGVLTTPTRSRATAAAFCASSSLVIEAAPVAASACWRAACRVRYSAWLSTSASSLWVSSHCARAVSTRGAGVVEFGLGLVERQPERLGVELDAAACRPPPPRDRAPAPRRRGPTPRARSARCRP